MTQMDDQVAKHIKQIILGVTRRPTDDQEQPTRPDILSQVVKMLRRGPDRIYGLIPPRHLPLRDDSSGTYRQLRLSLT